MGGGPYEDDLRTLAEDAPDGSVVTRFAPQTDPQDAGVTAAVEKLLPR